MIDMATTLAAGVLAVTGPGGDGYEAPLVRTYFPFLALVYTLLFLAAICVVAFKDAHRTYLD